VIKSGSMIVSNTKYRILKTMLFKCTPGNVSVKNLSTAVIAVEAIWTGTNINGMKLRFDRKRSAVRRVGEIAPPQYGEILALYLKGVRNIIKSKLPSTLAPGTYTVNLVQSGRIVSTDDPSGIVISN